MASKMYADLLRQGFMKKPKAARSPARSPACSREDKARELSQILGVPVTAVAGGRYRVPHALGHDNYLTYTEAKRFKC